MPTSSNRFGLSALSRSQKANSALEEMMIDKETGQHLIKTPSGDIISYDSIARMRSHINDLSLLAQTNGLRGDMNSIEFDNMELPSKVTENTNLLTSPLTIKTGNLKRFLFSVDVDTIELSSTDVIGQHEPTVTIDIQYSLGATNTNKTITGKLSEVNTRIVNAAEHFAPGTDLTGHSLKITSIKVIKNTTYTTQSLRHILHSVLIITE